MAIVVGKGAAVSMGSVVKCVRNWRIAITGTDTAAACSASAGAVVRGVGNSDWEGVCVAYGTTPPVIPGDPFTFSGTDNNGAGWTGAAICSRIRIIAPILTGKFIYYEIHFAANGSLLKQATTAIVDTMATAGVSAKAVDVYIGGTKQTGVIQWEVIIDGKLTDPSWQSDSATDINGNVWPFRAMGNIDAIFKYTQRIPDTSLPLLHSLNSIAFSCSDTGNTSTDTWSMNWGRLLELPVEYPIEGQGGKGEFIVAQDLVFGFTGYNGATKGFIKSPGGNIWV